MRGGIAKCERGKGRLGDGYIRDDEKTEENASEM